MLNIKWTSVLNFPHEITTHLKFPKCELHKAKVALYRQKTGVTQYDMVIVIICNYVYNYKVYDFLANILCLTDNKQRFWKKVSCWEAS